MKKFCLIFCVLLFSLSHASFVDTLKSKKVVGRTSIAVGLGFTGLAALAHYFVDFTMELDIDEDVMVEAYARYENNDPSHIAQQVDQFTQNQLQQQQNNNDDGDDDESSEMPFVWETLKKNAPRNRNICLVLAGMSFGVSVWNYKFR